MTDLIDIYTTNIENNLSSINSKFSQCELCSSSQFKSIIKEIESLMKDTEKIIKIFNLKFSASSITAELVSHNLHRRNFRQSLP